MVKYYTVTADLKTGCEVDYSFYHLADAEKKYNRLTGANVTYKSIIATDDCTGDTIIRSE